MTLRTRTIRGRKTACWSKPETAVWPPTRETEDVNASNVAETEKASPSSAYMFRVYVGGALISILLKSTWTGHLAGENLTYDLFVESPSLLYTSVGKTAQESLFCHLSKTSNCIFTKTSDTFLTLFFNYVS